MVMDIRKLLMTRDLGGLKKALEADPSLANKEISLAENDEHYAHPLHRICDGVFAKMYTDEEAVEIASIFLDHGASIDGNELKEGKDSPLTAAASLSADAVAILYIDRGANIHHPGCHGGTALHWAAWCGRDRIVKRLLAEKPDINKKCFDFKSTPLFWAVHGYNFGGENNRYRQVECARLLVQAGADKNTTNFEGYNILELLRETDDELRALLT
jgi:uncharacterized protein